MAERIDLLKHLTADESLSYHNMSFELVRLGSDETVVITFTSDAVPVKVHYCGETEIRGYVLCNGDKCLLCRIGRVPSEKLLLPVYCPVSSTIGVLPISWSNRPGSLGPKLLPILRAGKRQLVFIRKPDRTRFEVRFEALKDGMDDGAKTIKTFQNWWEENEVDLTSVYLQIANRDLADVPSIAKMLPYKGIDPNAID